MLATISEIESAIEKLPREEIAKLSEWLEEFEAQLWDEQIERDYNSGKLQFLIAEADVEFDAGTAKKL